MVITVNGYNVQGTPDEIRVLTNLLDRPTRTGGRVKDVAKMQELRAQGKTYKQIARACGWSKTTVHNCLREVQV